MSEKKRLFIDRKNATRCNDVTGLNQILIDLKPKRSLSELYINQKFDVTNLVKYVEGKKSEDLKITYFHAFTTAVGKLLYLRPLLNRFVSNRRVYEHDDVTVSFVMKIDFEDKSQEVMVILPILSNDNIYTISEKISNKVNSVRSHKDMGCGANNAIQVLGKLPNIVRVPLVGAFKFLDNKGLLPSSLVQDNIYYSSMIVSNIGTLKCDGIYHNVTDFGTCSGLITMGEIKKNIINGEEKYFCEFGVTIDERIADGFYFIKCLKLLQNIFDNPNVLEENVDEKVEF